MRKKVTLKPGDILLYPYKEDNPRNVEVGIVLRIGGKIQFQDTRKIFIKWIPSLNNQRDRLELPLRDLPPPGIFDKEEFDINDVKREIIHKNWRHISINKSQS